MAENKIVIAIDGFSSTGKSTLAKQIAKKLEYLYVDSGAMYRAVTLYAMRAGLIDENHFNKEGLISSLNNIHVSFQFNKVLEFSEVYLNGINVEKDIRTLKVSSFVSQVSTVSEVRHQLVEQQKMMGRNKGVVMDGRDIGTVVFPDAELKLFMIASTETRAKRRFEELLGRGDSIIYADVLKNIEKRDYIDSNRKDSPLLKAKDAIEIDNSNITLEKQFDNLLHIVKLALSNEKLKSDN